MKKISALALAALLAVSASAFAGGTEGKTCTRKEAAACEKKETCDKTKCEKEKCDKDKCEYKAAKTKNA